MRNVGAALALVVVTLSLGGCRDPRTELTGLAGTSTCAIDSDCCIAVDGCSATAYPVDRSQVDTAVGLVDEANDGLCVNCIPPRGIPRCDDGRCRLTALDLDEEGPALDEVGKGVSCLPPDTEPVATEDPGRQAISCDTVDDE